MPTDRSELLLPAFTKPRKTSANLVATFRKFKYMSRIRPNALLVLPESKFQKWLPASFTRNINANSE